MKVRIHANSIRVRLTQSEVSRVAGGGRVEQTTSFSPLEKLLSRVECSPQVRKPVATFGNQSLTILLPSVEARQWAQSEQIGIEADQPIGDGTFLRLIVEKDLECLQPRAEETADAFPPPRRSADSSD
ncbi:MAG TPA: hypothetical protein VNJ12_01065 [Candidatus Dormibacteraeota bacterium]|nr:hypothetical protein [Candidatus Dormibacteraeota bacterium]